MLSTILAAADAYGVTEFGTQMTGAANGALPYIGAGVGAGVVVFALVFGIKKGMKALRSVAN